MAEAIDELATYAQTESVGTIGTTLFRFSLFDSPDAQVAIIPYAGDESEDGFGKTNGPRWEHTRFQIVSRGAINDKRTAYTKACAAHVAFSKVHASTLSGTFYETAKPLQKPGSIGEDASGRPMFSFNIHVVRDLGA